MLFDAPKRDIAYRHRHRPAIEVGNAARWYFTPDGSWQETVLQTPALLEPLPIIDADMETIRCTDPQWLTLEGEYQRAIGYPASHEAWQLRPDSLLARLQQYVQHLARLQTLALSLQLSPLAQAFLNTFGELAQERLGDLLYRDQAADQLAKTQERLQSLQQRFKGTHPFLSGLPKNAVANRQKKAHHRAERARRYFSERFRAHSALDVVRIELGTQPPSLAPEQAHELLRQRRPFFGGKQYDALFEGLAGHAAWLQADPDKGFHLALVLLYEPGVVINEGELLTRLGQRWAELAKTEGPVCWAAPPGQPAYATGRLQPADYPEHRERLQHLIDYATTFKQYLTFQLEGSQPQTERYDPEPRAKK